MIGQKGHKIAQGFLSPWKFKLAMLRQLPSVVFWGISISKLDGQECRVKLPFKWRTQNPFRSIYFAALAGAGELATGALAMVHTADRGKWSMLVVGFRSEFNKKSTTNIVFSCNQGEDLALTLDKIEATGQPATLELVAIATNDAGEEVARAFITWSFKKKS